jgi:hypothetical protein
VAFIDAVEDYLEFCRNRQSWAAPKIADDHWQFTHEPEDAVPEIISAK